MKLLLFDIDGTLIKSGADASHRASFSYAIEQVFGITVDMKSIVSSGKIDSQILIELLEINGIPPTESQKKISQMFRYMIDYFKERSTDLKKFVLPHVLETLEALKEKDNLVIGILTGNVDEVGWMKLEQAGLRDFFQIGVFGNEALKRADLVPKALEKVKNFEIGLKDTYIIGDTPLDIKCAKEAGCLAVAIPSGSYSAEELGKETPDYLLKDIIELTDIL